MSDQENRDVRRESENLLLDRLAEIRAERADMPQEAAALLRMVDFRIPLWSVIVFCAIGIGGVMSMYYKLEKVAENLTDLQITVRAGNGAAVTAFGQIELLKYRVENLENARARENGEPTPRR